MRHLMTCSDALQYILAGNRIVKTDKVLKQTMVKEGPATLTIENSESGNWFTYKLFKPDENKDFYFVRVLNGPDNTKNYMYIGSISNGQFRHTEKSRVQTSSLSFRVFASVFQGMQQGNLPTKIKLYRNNYCGKCGRKLTVPQSITNGIGPECLKMLHQR